MSTRCITESCIPSITKHGEILASCWSKVRYRAPLSRWKSVRSRIQKFYGYPRPTYTSDLWTLDPPVAHSHPSLGLAPLKLLPDVIALTERRGSIHLPSHGRSKVHSARSSRTRLPSSSCYQRHWTLIRLNSGCKGLVGLWTRATPGRAVCLFLAILPGWVSCLFTPAVGSLWSDAHP